MKQLYVTGPRQVVFEEAPTPECSPDGLVVRARTTAVSPGTEIRVYRAIPVDEKGEFLHERIPFVLPTTNGYSMVGEVVEVGSAVERFGVGDRVFVPAPHAEMAALAADLAFKLPDELSDEQAVFLNIMEVGHLALRRGRPGLGENVAIVGQGVIGLSALAYCRAFGLRTAVVDLNETRLAVARKMGADLAVSPQQSDFLEQVQKAFDGAGADLVLEAASNWNAVRTGMQLARTGGTIMVISRHTSVPDFNPVGHPFLGKQLTVLTSYGYPGDGARWDREHSYALTARLLAERRINIEPFITHRFDWSDLPEAYERFDKGDPELIGAVIRW